MVKKNLAFNKITEGLKLKDYTYKFALHNTVQLQLNTKNKQKFRTFVFKKKVIQNFLLSF